jgi:hypothetical protein
MHFFVHIPRATLKQRKHMLWKFNYNNISFHPITSKQKTVCSKHEIKMEINTQYKVYILSVPCYGVAHGCSTEHRGQAPSAPLCIRQVAGSNPVAA